MKALLMRFYNWFWRKWYDLLKPDGEGDYTVTAHEAYIRLKEIWPDLQWSQVKNPDAKLKVTSLAKHQEVDRWMQTWIARLGMAWKWLEEIFDCDDFALVRKSFDRIHGALEFAKGKVPLALKHARAIGEIWGSQMMSVKSPHAVNVLIVHEGVYLEEPQTFVYEKADPERDKPIDVRW